MENRNKEKNYQNNQRNSDTTKTKIPYRFLVPYYCLYVVICLFAPAFISVVNNEETVFMLALDLIVFYFPTKFLRVRLAEISGYKKEIIKRILVLIFLCLYLLIGINFILLNILLFGKLQSDKVVPVLIALIVLVIACVVFVLSFKKIMTYYRKKEKAIIEKEQILSKK